MDFSAIQSVITEVEMRHNNVYDIQKTETHYFHFLKT